MQALFRWIARLAGALGVALMMLAVMGRLAGAFWLGGFQVGTMLQAGMAATLVGCFGYLAALAERPGERREI